MFSDGIQRFIESHVGSASIRDSNLIYSCRRLVADVRGILEQEIFQETVKVSKEVGLS